MVEKITSVRFVERKSRTGRKAGQRGTEGSERRVGERKGGGGWGTGGGGNDRTGVFVVLAPGVVGWPRTLLASGNRSCEPGKML